MPDVIGSFTISMLDNGELEWKQHDREGSRVVPVNIGLFERVLIQALAFTSRTLTAAQVVQAMEQQRMFREAQRNSQGR